MKDEKEKWELIDEIGKDLTNIISLLEIVKTFPTKAGAELVSSRSLSAKDKINKLKSLIIKEVTSSH